MQTTKETLDFQRAHGLPQTGLIGAEDWQALKTAFMPSKPPFMPMTEDMKKQAYGDPLGGVPLAGHIDTFVPAQSFYRHIISVDVPTWFKPTGRCAFHMLGKDRLQSLLATWESAGVHEHVKTFAGSVAFRRVRGGTHLSSHAFGIAFDINVAWNQLGQLPAMPWQEGCVLELVKLANAHGFYWGGHFSRMDGMHWELSA